MSEIIFTIYTHNRMLLLQSRRNVYWTLNTGMQGDFAESKQKCRNSLCDLRFSSANNRRKDIKFETVEMNLPVYFFWKQVIVADVTEK